MVSGRSFGLVGIAGQNCITIAWMLLQKSSWAHFTASVVPAIRICEITSWTRLKTFEWATGKASG